ncbi:MULTISPECIES: lipopolysaccharide biosynthesis protein [unclassified Brevundimonas]|uniref:lipopolysaccharide biosynthesis protein n=1 Tax=unclassified Brevundimonas TaxID=2622653 RepID=UPI0025BB2A34|nr:MULTISPECIES: polysaccharide biosynthesis C-terminal domain-containing protein [unclassified Brevundimonas]
MFVRGLMGYLPANLLQALIGVVSILVFTRLLTPEEFGIYALSFALMALVHVAVFSWAEAAMERHWAAEVSPNRQPVLYATLYRALLVLSVAFVIVIILVCAFLPVSDVLRSAVLVALLGVPVRSLFNMVKLAHRARGDVVRAAGLDIYYTLCVFAVGVAAAFIGAGASAPLIGLLVAPLAILPFILPTELAKARDGICEGASLKRYARYGYPISLSLGMALALASTDRFMLEWLMNAAAVGAYHASYSIANRTLDVIFIWLGAAGAPAMIMALERGGQSALSVAAKDQFRIFMLVAIPAAVGVALVARPLSEVVIGEALRADSALVTPWIALSALMSGFLYYYFNQAFTLAKQTRVLLLTMPLPAVANIGFNWFLIPRMGIEGAAIATVLGYGVGLCVSIAVGRHVLPMPVAWRDTGKCLICAGVMALAVIAIPNLGGLLELVLKSMAGAVVYAACAYLLDAAGVRQLVVNLKTEILSRPKVRA